MPGYSHTVTERFLRYVRIDTQSSHTSTTYPSTEKQKDLGRLLVKELHEIGIADAHLDEFGYVYATVPSNTTKTVPVICFCAHMDTSPDVTGKDVKPQIVRNYQGGDIALPGDPSQVIRVADNPALKDQIGHDIITTDGTTLLGADNKAGVAEIMDAVNILVTHPDIKHGTLKILFTPDEEVGHGVDHVDIKKLGADFAYTMDGESAGNLEDETFSADKATLTIRGVSAHPGFAKGKIENAIKIASRIIERLPRDTCSPETTEGREGFLHPTDLQATLEGATLSFIVRDFTEEGLREKEALLDTDREGRDARLSAFDLRDPHRGAVPQHEGRARQVPAGHRERARSDPPCRPHAKADEHPRRHRRLTAFVHGPPLPQYLCRRARVSLAARMGERAGHGKGGRDHHPSRR